MAIEHLNQLEIDRELEMETSLVGQLEYALSNEFIMSDFDSIVLDHTLFDEHQHEQTHFVSLVGQLESVGKGTVEEVDPLFFDFVSGFQNNGTQILGLHFNHFLQAEDEYVAI